MGVGWGGGVQTKFVKRGGGRVGNIVGVFIKLAPFVNYLKRLSHPPHTWVPPISSENLSSPPLQPFLRKFHPPFYEGRGLGPRPACKFTKKTLSYFLYHVFGLNFLRMHHGYFFRRRFESVRAQFFSGESSITCNLPIQSQFI